MGMAAPALGGEGGWLNVGDPPDLEGLKGRLVVLYFWHPGSSECLLTLELIKRTQKEFEDRVYPICVFTPRYPGHAEVGVARRAIARHHIYHPVAHDRDFALWRDYEVGAWPTIVLIDEQGDLAWVAQGLDESGALAEECRKRLDSIPPLSSSFDAPAVSNERAPDPSGVWFPGGICATDDCFFVSDTGRNRVLEFSREGRLRRAFGAGTPGHWDGEGINAGFTDPAGIVRFRGGLIVADSGNHCLRRIDLTTNQVTTIAGRGERGRRLPLTPTPGADVRMRYPTGLHLHGDDLYVAMAGMHQVWRVDPAGGESQVLGGSGHRGRVDGEGVHGAMATPWALSRVQSRLVVVDAASSSLRAMRINDGHLTTLVGGGLWDAGLVDGDPETARMQFPTGVAADSRAGLVWIADTLNHRLRQYDSRSQQTTTVALDHPLIEPGALDLRDGILWVTNSGAHEILRVDTRDLSFEVVPLSGSPHELGAF